MQFAGQSYGLPGVQPQSFVGGTGAYGGIQGFASRGLGGTQGYTVAAPSVSQPLAQSARPGQAAAMPQVSMNAPAGPIGTQRNIPVMSQADPAAFQSQGAVVSRREQALEARVRELEQILAQKDETIQDLQQALNSSGKASYRGDGKGNNSKVRSPGRTGNGFRKVSESKPVIRYAAIDQDDPIDVRLEEFYNSTGSAIQFRRINRGFYRFGDSIVELDIINHKLMARTEDGWNRGKFGPIEKFLMYYENIEREKAGILPES